MERESRDVQLEQHLKDPEGPCVSDRRVRVGDRDLGHAVGSDDEEGNANGEEQASSSWIQAERHHCAADSDERNDDDTCAPVSAF